MDDSGELSYQEARCFLKGIQEFLEDDPDISEEQKEKIAKEMVEACKLFWDVNTFFLNLSLKCIFNGFQVLTRFIQLI